MMTFAAMLLATAQPAVGRYAAADAPRAISPEWSYAESVDPLTRLPVASAWVASSDGRWSLTLSCRSGDADRTLSFRVAGSRFLGSSRLWTVVRLDDAQPVEGRWDSVMGKMAALVERDQVADMIRHLASARRAFIRIFDYEDQPHDAVFDVGGAKPAMDRVMVTCGWNPANPRKRLK